MFSPEDVMATKCTLIDSDFGMAAMWTIDLKFDLSIVLNENRNNLLYCSLIKIMNGNHDFYDLSCFFVHTTRHLADA